MSIRRCHQTILRFIFPLHLRISSTPPKPKIPNSQRHRMWPPSICELPHLHYLDQPSQSVIDFPSPVTLLLFSARTIISSSGNPDVVGSAALHRNIQVKIPTASSLPAKETPPMSIRA